MWIKRVAPDAEHERLACALEAGERARADRFVRKADCRAYVTAHWLLRHALSWAQPSVEPSAWRFRTTAYGKPELAADWPGIRFSLSHCLEYTAVVLADGIDCGVDVESMRRAGDLGPLAGSVLSPRELAAFRAAGEGQRQVFFRCWTLKEAYAKAVGLGLRLPFDELDFGFGTPIELTDETLSRHPVRGWAFEQWFRDGNSFAAAFSRPPGASPVLVVRDAQCLARG